jgi:hypothetical protein
MSEWSFNKTRDLLFGVRMSIRYHKARQGFFNGWSKMFKFLSIISGLSVTANAIASGPPVLFIVAGVVVAVGQAAELVVGLDAKSHLHDDITKQFLILEADIVKALSSRDVDEGQYSAFVNERLTIERAEGQTLLWLSVSARNAQVIEQKGSNAPEIINIPWHQKLLVNYIDVAPLKTAN